MRYKLIILTICLIALVFLTGCKEGSGFGSLSGDSDYFLTHGEGGGSSGDGNDSSSGSNAPPDIGNAAHMPEPATGTLLGSGILAYALLRRRKRRL